MFFDHYEKVGYAVLSPRTDKLLAKKYIESCGYRPVLFRAVKDGIEIYHTNVMMAVTECLIIVCTEVLDVQGRAWLEKLEKPVMEITIEQMNSFAGNMLELNGPNDESILAMSTRAYGCLTQSQIQLLEVNHQICQLPLAKIETIGGGSARCMIAENFLPIK